MSVRTRTDQNGFNPKRVMPKNQNYVCNKAFRKVCKAKSVYNGEAADKVVIDEIYNYLETVKATSLQTKIQAQKKKIIKSHELKLTPIEAELKKSAFELDRLNDETIKCIMGESGFSSEQLTQITEQKENELSDLTHKKQEIETLLSEQLKEFAQFEEIHNSIPNWKKEFEKSDLLTKQVLIANLVDSVTVFHDKMEIHFKLNLYKINSPKYL